MLTTTYSMVVLSSEQQNTRRIVHTLEQVLQNGTWLCADGIDRAWLERVLQKLVKVHRYCHQRKVERFVIPALRQASTEASNLLDRLDTLVDEARRILLHVCSQFESAASGRIADIVALVTAVELYCRQMMTRLTLEEDELFPVARRHLSTEAWFGIAASCLAETTGRRNDRARVKTAPPGADEQQQRTVH